MTFFPKQLTKEEQKKFLAEPTLFVTIKIRNNIEPILIVWTKKIKYNSVPQKKVQCVMKVELSS